MNKEGGLYVKLCRYIFSYRNCCSVVRVYGNCGVGHRDRQDPVRCFLDPIGHLVHSWENTIRMNVFRQLKFPGSQDSREFIFPGDPQTGYLPADDQGLPRPGHAEDASAHCCRPHPLRLKKPALFSPHADFSLSTLGHFHETSWQMPAGPLASLRPIFKNRFGKIPPRRTELYLGAIDSFLIRPRIALGRGGTSDNR